MTSTCIRHSYVEVHVQMHVKSVCIVYTHIRTYDGHCLKLSLGHGPCSVQSCMCEKISEYVFSLKALHPEPSSDAFGHPYARALRVSQIFHPAAFIRQSVPLTLNPPLLRDLRSIPQFCNFYLFFDVQVTTFPPTQPSRNLTITPPGRKSQTQGSSHCPNGMQRFLLKGSMSKEYLSTLDCRIV